MVLPRPVYLTRPGKFVVGSHAGRILNVAAPEYSHHFSVVPRSVDTPAGWITPDTPPVKLSSAPSPSRPMGVGRCAGFDVN